MPPDPGLSRCRGERPPFLITLLTAHHGAFRISGGGHVTPPSSPLADPGSVTRQPRVSPAGQAGLGLALAGLVGKLPTGLHGGLIIVGTGPGGVSRDGRALEAGGAGGGAGAFRGTCPASPPPPLLFCREDG